MQRPAPLHGFMLAALARADRARRVAAAAARMEGRADRQYRGARERGSRSPSKRRPHSRARGDDPAIYRVRVEGRFHHAKELYLYAVSDGPGWHVITPLETAEGTWCWSTAASSPTHLKIRHRARRAGRERVAVTGLVRVPRRPKAPSCLTTSPRPIAGSGAIFRHGAVGISRRRHPSRPSSSRRRASDAGRLAAGRPDPARPSQQPSAICASPGFCSPLASSLFMLSMCGASFAGSG